MSKHCVSAYNNRSQVGAPATYEAFKLSRDAAVSRIPAPHLLKQEQLQLAGASFRDEWKKLTICLAHLSQLKKVGRSRLC